MFPLSCIFNKCLCVSYYMAQYLLDRPHILVDHLQPSQSPVVTLLCRTGMHMADATTEMGFLISVGMMGSWSS